jgi:hypothetical protein
VLVDYPDSEVHELLKALQQSTSLMTQPANKAGSFLSRSAVLFCTDAKARTGEALGGGVNSLVQGEITMADMLSLAHNYLLDHKGNVVSHNSDNGSTDRK